MHILFIGGTGIISSACAREAVAHGHRLTLLTRGHSARPAPPEAEIVRGDVGDPATLEALLRDRSFDAVVNWIVFAPEQVERDIASFGGRVGQYVFISSASAYQTPPARLPVTESTPLRNPFWAYSRAKIACEDRLIRAYRDDGFPATIVRPSHTYDRTLLPMRGGWTVVERMRRGAPVVVHGDGTSLWTMTHHADFARAFVPLLGHPAVAGEAVHITSDETLSWNQIVEQVAAAAGVEPRIVHAPSALIAAYDAEWGASLLGDKAHSMVFDNGKIKGLAPGWRAAIPFWQGAREIVGWYDADPGRRRVDPAFDALLDRMVAGMERAGPA